MKNIPLTLLVMLFLCSLAQAISISPETGEVIPRHVLTDPNYHSLPAPEADDMRDVGSWTGSGPWGGNVRSIITDPANPLHVFAACGFNLATVVGGVYASTDGGINWQATTLQGKPYYALAGSASEPGVFYAGARNGLYKSTDNGATWTADGLSSIFILSLGVKPDNGNTIVVGKSGNVGLVVSTDGGTNFNQVGVNTGFMRQFAYSAANPGRMFVVMGSSTSSVLTSIDNGQTWSNYGPAGDGWGMYVSPTDSLFSIIAHGSGIYRTTDGGVNWTQAIGGVFRSVVEYNGTFFATANAGGVYQSNDQGVTWQPYNVGVVQSTWQAAATTGAGALLGYWGGISRATGYQVPLLTSHSGINAAFVHGLAYYSDTNELWGGAEGSGIYRSTDNGATWEQRVNGLDSWMVYELVPTNHQYYQSGRMLVGTLNGVFTSTDGGNTWTLVDYQANQCTALEVHPTDPDKFWIGTSAGEIKYTADGGQTWTIATGPQFGFAPRLKLGKGPLGTPRLFLCYQGSATAVWYSDNNGATFTASTGMESTQYQTMVAVRPEYGWQTQIIYAASDLGVYKSTDNGATFTLSGLSGFCWSVMCSPGMQVISGKESGLSYSTDEGGTSSSLTQNLTNTTVWQMAWGSSTNQLYIATRGKGVMEYRFDANVYTAPTELTADPGNGQISLTWTPVNSTPAPVGYIIWRDGYPIHQVNADQSSWVNSALNNGQVYQFSVSAVYPGNVQTTPSEIITAVPVEIQLLPPTDLTASFIPPSMIYLSWSHPTGALPDGYRMYRNGTVLYDFIEPVQPTMIITNVAPGEYSFNVTAIYDGGESVFSNTATVVVVSNDDNQQPQLSNGIVCVGPNPFRTLASIRYQNAKKQIVDVSVYNLKGQRIRTLVDEKKQAGVFTTEWNGTDFSNHQVASGIYYIRMQAGNRTYSIKTVFLR